MEDTRRKGAAGLLPESQALVPCGRKGVALPACLVSAVASPAFGLTQLNGQVWVLDPLPPDTPPPQQSYPACWFSHPADLPLSTASATDIVEVLLEMEVKKRLQENAPERVKPRGQ